MRVQRGAAVRTFPERAAQAVQLSREALTAVA